MSLAGELSTIGLPEVFQNLAFNAHTGTLTLVDGDRKARLCFLEGKIRAVKIEGEEFDFLAIAEYAGAAPPESLEKARQAKRRRTVRAFLRAAGPFDEGAYDAMVAGYVQEALLPLFGWTKAKFDFENGLLHARVFGKELLDCNVTLDPVGVAMEAARRHDEWEGIEPYIPRDDQILVLAGGWPAGELPVSERRVLELLDGTRDLAQAVKDAPLRKFDVFKTVAQLVERGALIPATAGRLREMAAQAHTAGRVALAAARLETALQLEPQDLDARRDLVRLHERAGRKLDAAAEQVKLAEAQTERGDVEGALESYERACVLAPKDLDVLERIFELHGTLGNHAQSMRAGRRLAEALVAAEMYEDALPLYQRLLEGNEGNSPLRESLAHCLQQAGDTAGAAEQLLVVADRMHEKREFDGARRYYERILAIDPECMGAAARLEEIESGAAQARIRGRRRRRVLLVLTGVFGLCTLQGVREWFAQGALHEAQLATVHALSRDNADDARIEAMDRYASIADAHGWTRGAAHARTTVHALLAAEIKRLHESLRQAEKAQTTMDLEYHIVRVRKLLPRIDALPLPDECRAHWDAERPKLVRRLETVGATDDGR